MDFNRAKQHGTLGQEVVLLSHSSRVSSLKFNTELGLLSVCNFVSALCGFDHGSPFILNPPPKNMMVCKLMVLLYITPKHE